MNIVDLIYGKNQVKCPRCGAKLNRNRLRSTSVNRCKNGCGVWIDQQQLDQIMGTKTNRYEVTSDLPATIPDQNTAV
ncbi:MAG: zf-TFIIB domain-containing protein [Planctomycetota bacterium]